MTLYELNTMVRETIELTLTEEYWVEAELSEVHERNGHCFIDLVQKDDRGNTPVARASARCWASQWQMLRPYFEHTTGQHFCAGLKVRLRVYPQFHQAYGFSWIVTDIDAAFTLGDMARRRQEIIRRLKEQGVFDLQRELEIPMFCVNIAVISSPTAAGYGDFCEQLRESGFAFNVQLYAAIMQGEQVEESIICALEDIFTDHESERSDAFHADCVVIIRGGGSTADMSGFDTLDLAENVANFPLPIITGIGHDRDECVLDMVSHLRVKTPTAAADFLIKRAIDLWEAITAAETAITRSIQSRLELEQMRLGRIADAITRIFPTIKARQQTRIESLTARLHTAIRQHLSTNLQHLSTIEQRLPLILAQRITAERHRIELIEEKTRALDPQLLLKRGYSITTHNGKVIHSPAELQQGDRIETRLEQGTIQSIIQ